VSLRIIELHGGQDRRFCADYEPMLGTRIGTVCSVVMDLTRGQLWVRSGPRPEAPFEAVDL